MDPSIVYRSAAMSGVMNLATRVARTDAGVLITGESGTGKNLLAEYIHRLGERGKGPFVTVACANIPAELFESELFGHEPGAHTDAVSRKPGRFEAAHGGTIYLDDVGALSRPLQAKLLRVLQERSFERLGGTRAVKVDVRVIASGADGLEADAKSGRFRDDLFYRLNVVNLALPPLRERPEDIVPLSTFFLGRLRAVYGGKRRRLTADARRALKGYAWPGNVRELSNVLEGAVIATDGASLGPEALPLPQGTAAEELAREAFEKRWSLRALEAAYIRNVLKAARGNKTRAARILGINRKTLLQKLKGSAR